MQRAPPEEQDGTPSIINKDWLNLVVVMINSCPLVKVLEMGSLKQSNFGNIFLVISCIPKLQFEEKATCISQLYYNRLTTRQQVNLHFPGLHQVFNQCFQRVSRVVLCFPPESSKTRFIMN